MEEIYKHFRLHQSVEEVFPFGSGHINDTYRLNIKNSHSGYLLQRINHHLFKDVADLMENIDRVTGHIRQKISPQEVAEGQTTLTIIRTREGNLFHKDTEANYWRVFDFLTSLKSYDFAESLQQVYEGAKNFGRFLNRLSDFWAESLHLTIPGFHDLFYRLDNLKLAIEINHNNRKRQVIKRT